MNTALWVVLIALLLMAGGSFAIGVSAELLNILFWLIIIVGTVKLIAAIL